MSTHLCDTCKYSEEECKFSRIVFNGENEVLKCDGYREDCKCSD